MKLIKGLPDRCFLSCLAMLLEEEPEKLLQECGYSGLEPLWHNDIEGRAAVLNYRGHHIQDLVKLALRRQRALVDVSPLPQLANPMDHSQVAYAWPKEEAVSFFEECLRAYPSILLSGHHSYVCDTIKVYDPDTLEGVVIEEFNKPVRAAWILV